MSVEPAESGTFDLCCIVDIYDVGRFFSSYYVITKRYTEPHLHHSQTHIASHVLLPVLSTNKPTTTKCGHRGVSQT